MITKKIFTFYPEPYNNYINLCIKTWEKYKPKDYKIIFLDKENIYKYVKAKYHSKTHKAIKENNIFLLSLIVIYSQGGIYLSPDTILMPNFSINTYLLKHSDIILYSLTPNYTHNGFVMGKKNSFTIENLIKKYKAQNTQNISSYTTTKTGFSISDIKNGLTNNKITILDSEKESFLVELSEYGVISKQIYKNFFFTNEYSLKDFLKKQNKIFALHQEHTPNEYKSMSEKNFLKQNILLTNILKIIN